VEIGGRCGNGCLSRDKYLGKLKMCATKGGRKKDGVRGKEMWDYRVLEPLCVFGCSSVVVESAYVRGCRGMGVCRVGMID
jgi:hypothetical protein